MEKPRTKLEKGANVLFDGHTCTVIDRNEDGTLDLYDVEHSKTWQSIPESAISHFDSIPAKNPKIPVQDDEIRINPIDLGAYETDPRIQHFSKQKEIQSFIDQKTVTVARLVQKIVDASKDDSVKYINPESLN